MCYTAYKPLRGKANKLGTTSAAERKPSSAKSCFARLIGYDGGMRFQFSTQQILLATAFVAITCGGIVGFRYVQSWFSSPALPWSLVWFYAAVATPLWMPSIFVAYAIGRRSFATRLV